MENMKSSTNPAIEPETTPNLQARLGTAVRLTLRQGWDRLGIVMAVSVTWLALLALPLTVGYRLPVSLPPGLRLGLMALVGTMLLAAPTAGAHHIAALIAEHDETSYLDFWLAARRLAGPATRLALLHLLVLSVFAANFWFYLHLGGFAGSVATFLCGYVLLFWSMMMALHYPLLVAQENGVFDEPDRPARRGALAVLRRALFLALGRPFYTLGLVAILVPVSVLFMASGVLLALLWAGGIALLTTQAVRLLLIQYGVLPPPLVEEPVPDEKFRIRTERPR
jgi:hypothetical protein